MNSLNSFENDDARYLLVDPVTLNPTYTGPPFDDYLLPVPDNLLPVPDNLLVHDIAVPVVGMEVEVKDNPTDIAAAESGEHFLLNLDQSREGNCLPNTVEPNISGMGQGWVLDCLPNGVVEPDISGMGQMLDVNFLPNNTAEPGSNSCMGQVLDVNSLPNIVEPDSSGMGQSWVFNGLPNNAVEPDVISGMHQESNDTPEDSGAAQQEHAHVSKKKRSKKVNNDRKFMYQIDINEKNYSAKELKAIKKAKYSREYREGFKAKAIQLEKENKVLNECYNSLKQQAEDVDKDIEEMEKELLRLGVSYDKC